MLPVVALLAATPPPLLSPGDPVPVGRALLPPTSSITAARERPRLPASIAVKPKVDILPVELEVALVIDPDFPDLTDDLVERALQSAATTFAERFNVSPLTMKVVARVSTREFLDAHVHADKPACKRLLDARYLGGGASELIRHRKRGAKFLEKWPLDSLQKFLTDDEKARVKDHADLYIAAAAHYSRTVGLLASSKTPAGTPLVDPAANPDRSFAAWSCALSEQALYDVVITNTFILADVMSEPHPHAVFGKAKIGGIAGPNRHRTALGRQALLASTFGIDTDIAFLSELGGQAATLDERAAMLGDYLLAHEIAHAIFGIPDFFDHPASCLMTSRPDETYRDGLELLRRNPGPCAQCRKWVEARGLMDEGRRLIAEDRGKKALKALARASRKTPRHFHGSYKRRMSLISVLVSEAYGALGKEQRATEFAKRAVDLDPKFPDAQDRWVTVTSTVTQR